MYDKEQFLQAIRDKLPNVFVADEHPFTELVYKPLDILREHWEEMAEYMIQILGLKPDMPDEYVDRIASNFLITRGQGTKARGYVTIAFSTPVAGLDLSKAVFTTGQYSNQRK